MLLLLLTALLSTPALAGKEADQAEYMRLHGEMEKLAQKGAWTGVERTYQRIQELGVELGYTDYVNAAHAARQAGDVTEARSRLKMAVEIKEEREILDWLWEIDTNYGQVSIKTDLGAYALDMAQMPFEPDRAKAVRFAQDQITQTGTFEGYLPEGEYTIGEYELQVRPRVQAARVDLRTGDDPGRKPPKIKEPKPPRERKPPKVKEPKPPKELKAPGESTSLTESLLYFGPEAQPFSVLVGALGGWEWGLGFVYRFGGAEPRAALAAGAGADLYDVLFAPAGVEKAVVWSAQLSGRFYPWGPLYLDATYGPLVWSDINKAYYGPSLGVGVELGRSGPLSVDANFGPGFAPAAPESRFTARGGICLSINFGG